MKIRRWPIYLQQSLSSFLLVIDISNQNFSIWHLKNIIGQIEKVTFRSDIHVWTQILDDINSLWVALSKSKNCKLAV